MKIEIDNSLYHYEPYQSIADSELSSIMSRAFDPQDALHTSSLADTHLPLYPLEYHADPHPHRSLKIESLDDKSFDEWCHDHEHDHADHTTTSYHSSSLEIVQDWTGQQIYPHLSSSHCVETTAFGLLPTPPYAAEPTSFPQTTYQAFDEGHGMSPWSSSSAFAYNRPAISIEEDDEALDDKPYARLIYEALMQAPGHRMLLRDIYEWFRQNTSKVQESGSNGWQNSIRHNLSMNKAFENDRDQSSSSTRKANSVWILTEEAVKNGVQSTTRYRKTGAGKKVQGGRTPAIQRQRSGARGGRAARRAARQRHQDHHGSTDPTPSGSPASTPYSEFSEFPGFDYHGLPPAVQSWPMTPVEDNLGDEAIIQQHELSALSGLNFGAHQHLGYGDDAMQLASGLLQPTRDLQVNEMIRFHAE